MLNSHFCPHKITRNTFALTVRSQSLAGLQMEATTQYAKLTTPLSCTKAATFSHNSITFWRHNRLPRKLQYNVRQLRYAGAISASESENSSTDSSARWLLEPVGDGDTRHIGFKTAMPGAYEIASSIVTVGRVPEKADIVIPVPTVSAMHARIRNTEESLLVVDLDSTNGTFIDEKRLTPGVPSIAAPGNKITFGDTHLAIFRLSKLENVETISEAEESEAKSEDMEPSSN